MVKKKNRNILIQKIELIKKNIFVVEHYLILFEFHIMWILLFSFINKIIQLNEEVQKVMFLLVIIYGYNFLLLINFLTSKLNFAGMCLIQKYGYAEMLQLSDTEFIHELYFNENVRDQFKKYASFDIRRIEFYKKCLFSIF